MLSVYDLYRMRKINNKKYEKIYNKILNKCSQFIKRANLLGENMCFFEIPDFILGEPTYDLNSCVGYIIKRLKEKGFNVILISNNIIIITWAFNNLEKKNPNRINDIQLLIK